MNAHLIAIIASSRNLNLIICLEALGCLCIKRLTGLPEHPVYMLVYFNSML